MNIIHSPYSVKMMTIYDADDKRNRSNRYSSRSRPLIMAFHLFTDASDYQIGAVLTQEHQPIAFFSRKLNDAQKKYGVGEKEMLSIVETLKEFRTILLGYPVIIHTDHKNLAFDKQINSPRILRWRMYIEEYIPTINGFQEIFSHDILLKKNRLT